MTALFKLDKVSKYVTIDNQKQPILKNINLEIQTGDFVSILGPSGSGKSTLLNIMSKIDQFDEGNLFFEGNSIGDYSSKASVNFRKEIGFIFQEYELIESLTVRDNIKIMDLLGSFHSDYDAIVAKLGLTEHQHKYPSQLSGGQKQRVAIARALIKNPKVLFCDEPTGALDEQNGREVLDILLQLNKEGVTVVAVTHFYEMMKLSNLVIKFKNGEILSVEEKEKETNVANINWF